MREWSQEYLDFLAYPPMKWYFLLSAAALVVLASLRQSRTIGALAPSKLAAFVFPRAIYRHRSTKTDLQYALLIPIVALLLFSPAISILQAWIDQTSSSTESLLGWASTVPNAQPRTADSGRIVSVVAFSVLFAMAADLGFYLHHYAMHKIPFLWEFHKVHHSAEVLTPLTDFRAHPLESLTYGLFTVTVLGVVQATTSYVLGTEPDVATLFGMNVVFFAYYFMGYTLRHSHFWISYGPILNRVFISPAQHQIHHSDAPEHFDKNLGGAFALWDWAAGTLYVPNGKEDLRFGLGPETVEYQRPTDLLLRPFKVNLLRSRTAAITIVALLSCLAFFAFSPLAG